MVSTDADRRGRDAAGRARNARSRDSLGRPLERSDGKAPDDEPALAPAAALVRAQTLLDEERPFIAHEVLEAVWKDTTGADRELWRGLAQLAVGITHALRGNEAGARALLQRAVETLAPLAATTPSDVDVDGVQAWAARAADDLALVTQPPRLVVGNTDQQPKNAMTSIDSAAATDSVKRARRP